MREPETLAPTFVPPWVEPLPTLIQRSEIETDEVPAAEPANIGSYEIVRELARGGMGVVYLARRHDLDREVALKMIHAGAHAGNEAIRRFRLEAEAISRLEHPNIVRIYDLGEHDARMYLVLEYVPGPNLLRRISGKPQPPLSAARLVATLARAMVFVHARGIVHRDLTPANVLLSRPPGAAESTADDEDLTRLTPKITDFGLAKRLDDESSGTRTGMVMGTPSYMSPEQAAGGRTNIGVASDIYALGAILYELLCGRPPFVGESALATLEQVLQVDPVSPRRLQPRVPRDLETICLRCLEKDPRARYPDATQLADDLERFLRGEPIRARPVGPLQRGWRWGKRRPAAAALIGLSLMCAVMLSAGGWWSNMRITMERDRAEQNFRQALRAIDEMLTQVGSETLAFEPRMDERRRALLRRALELYQEFLAERGADDRLIWETAHAYRRIGDIERWLGEFPDSRVAYTNALQLFERIDAAQPNSAVHRRWQAYCQNYLGEACRASSDTEAARRAYQRASQLSQALAKEHPQVTAYAQEFARAQYNLGILHRETGHAGEAETAMLASLAELHRLSAADADDASLKQETARAQLNLGPVYRVLGRPDEAIERYAEALRLFDELVAADPQRPEYRLELAVALANCGNARASLSNPRDALMDYERAASLLSKLMADHPSVPTLRQEMANTCNSMAAARTAVGELEAAESDWAEAVRLLRGLMEDFPELPSYQGDLGMSIGNLGWAEAEQKQFTDAREHLREGIEHLVHALQMNPRQPDYTRSLRSHLCTLGGVSLELKDGTAAIDAARRLARLESAGADDQLAAACLLVRTAAMFDQAPDDAAAESVRSAELCAEASLIIEKINALDSATPALKSSASDLLAENVKRHPSLERAQTLLTTSSDEVKANGP